MGCYSVIRPRYPGKQLDSGLVTFVKDISQVEFRAPADWQEVICPRPGDEQAEPLVAVMVTKSGREMLDGHPGSGQGERLDAVHNDGRARRKIAHKCLGRPDSNTMGV